MVTRVFNLILATGMSLLALSVAMDASSRSWDAEAILYAIIAPCWLAATIGLFFKSRLAWCGSLLGAGTMACSSVAIIGWSIILAPTAQDPSEGIGYAMIMGVFGAAMSLPVIIGLVRLRKHLRCEKVLDS